MEKRLLAEHGSKDAALAWMQQDMNRILYPYDPGVLDESSCCYKSLDEVMLRQQDVVVTESRRLRPLAVLKGTGKKPVTMQQAQAYVEAWQQHLRTRRY